MHKHEATIHWDRSDQKFEDNKYSRAHWWEFDGIKVPASPSPSFVPPPMSTLEAIDPEEALVAATSSCHMLFFLFIAAKKGFVVDSYHDQANGDMGKNADGKTMMAKITLQPKIVFSGDKQPDANELAQMRQSAHEQCFIGNSLKSEIVIEPV